MRLSVKCVGKTSINHGLQQAKNNASQICTISIYDDSLKEWISKSDGAELSNYSPIKGGLSDAFKRAAVKWGIGRYLYEITPVWVNVYMRGDKIYIQDDEMPKLQQRYITFLKKSEHRQHSRTAGRQGKTNIKAGKSTADTAADHYTFV